MIPAEKYMNINNYKGNNLHRASDMKFVPFNINSNEKSSNLSNLSNFTIGWIPIYLYPNMNQMLNMNNTNMNALNNMANMPNIMNIPNMNNENPPKSNTYNPNEYPAETNEDMLYSYNNPSMKNNSFTNMNKKREILKNTYESSKHYNKMLEVLKEFNVNLDEDTDVSRNNNEDIDKIYKQFEEENPGTFSLLKTYNVPYPIVKIIIKRIIKTSLKNCNKEGE